VFLLLMAIRGVVDRFAAAATLPTGFSETPVATGLASPTAMQFAPDGRLFVCEQGGRLRVIKDGALLPTPFLTLTVSSVGERGPLGVAFDPAFAMNHVNGLQIVPQ
jgi:glucose/arabinose dehydrogenase